MPTREQLAAEEAEKDFDDFARDIEQNPANRKPGGYFPLSGEPGGWELRGRAIRLDICVLSMRLLAFKIATRTFPTLTNNKLRSLRDSLVGFAAGRVAAWTGKEVIRQLGKWLTFVAQLFEAGKSQRELEQVIRGQSMVVMRQWHALALPQRKGTAHRKLVATRHLKR